MKKEFTLLIQGKVLASTYEFYIKNYKDFPIVISTWEDCEIDFDKNIDVLKSSYIDNSGFQNRNYQFYTTLVGLRNVKSKYVIKLRGDEEYSNLEKCIDFLIENDNKILTSPVFFRKWSYCPYHISDHLLIGKTENLLKMFKVAYEGVSKKPISNFFEKYPPEVVLGKTYIEECEKIKLSNDVSNVNLMIKFYDIIDLTYHKPYKIVGSRIGRVWNDNFIPENEDSISNINQLF